jgi:hypothetical protein
MIKFSHRTLILLSGGLWVAVGLYLLPLGIRFLVESSRLGGGHLYLLNALSSLGAKEETGALILVAIGLAIGYGKSRAVFSKVVNRGVDHIRSLPKEASLSAVYTKKYLVLLGVMVLLGVVMRWFPLDIRGLVDVIVGSALINGAVLYFRKAFEPLPQKEN